FALHVGFPESSESQIKKGEKAYQQHRAAITAIKEALAQPEQEPVATLDDLEQEIYENTRQFVSRDVMEWMLKRYYTTPPQRTWVGLTDDDEIPWDGVDAKSFAKAIEAKLKDKNL
ncbi:hypothetical protein UFOVP515_1, partial [uncultured Caudovirales phage]